MTDESTDLELMDEPFTLGCAPLAEKRGRPAIKADPESRRFNEALWRIVNGKLDAGGIYHELAILTGMSPESVRGRVNDIEYDPEPLEPQTEWTPDDGKYFGKLCKNHDDPRVREWFQTITGARRKHPDREDARVKRQRITRKDGTTRLTSLAIDPSRN